MLFERKYDICGLDLKKMLFDIKVLNILCSTEIESIKLLYTKQKKTWYIFFSSVHLSLLI